MKSFFAYICDTFPFTPVGIVLFIVSLQVVSIKTENNTVLVPCLLIIVVFMIVAKIKLFLFVLVTMLISMSFADLYATNGKVVGYEVDYSCGTVNSVSDSNISTVFATINGKYMVDDVVFYYEKAKEQPIQRYSTICVRGGAADLFRKTMVRIKPDNNESVSIHQTTIGGIVEQLQKTIDSTSFKYFGENSALVQAMVFGLSDNLDSETEKEFRLLGLGHILVASGANIMLILSVLGYVFDRISFRGRRLVELSIIITYCLLVGFQGSMIRAFLFFLVNFIALRVGREVSFSHKIFLTLAVSLFIFPTKVFGLSYMLSLLATISLRLSHDVIALMHIERSVSKAVIQNFIIIMVVNVFTAYSFRSFNLAGFFMNLVVLSLVEVIVLFGFGFIISALIVGWLPIDALLNIVAMPYNILLNIFDLVIKLGISLFSDNFNYSIGLNKNSVLIIFSTILLLWLGLTYKTYVKRVTRL